MVQNAWSFPETILLVRRQDLNFILSGVINNKLQDQDDVQIPINVQHYIEQQRFRLGVKDLTCIVRDSISPAYQTLFQQVPTYIMFFFISLFSSLSPFFTFFVSALRVHSSRIINPFSSFFLFKYIFIIRLIQQQPKEEDIIWKNQGS